MNHWLLWALLSAFFAGLTAVLAKVGVTGVDSTLAAAIRTTIVLVFTWLLVWIAAARGAQRDSSIFTGLNLHSLLFLVVSGLATGLSWICYFRALQLGEASRVAPVDKLSVLFVMICAAIWLKEPVGWQQWTGGALILAGAVVLAWKQ